jgi:DNA-directed RNA polymerase subunit beta'
VNTAVEGTIAVLDKNQKEVDVYDIPQGSLLYFLDGELARKGKLLAQWDPYNIPILSEINGVVSWNDIIPGETVKCLGKGKDCKTVSVVKHSKNYKPKITIKEPVTGNSVNYPLTPKTVIVVDVGTKVAVGSIIAKVPRSGRNGP